MSRVWNRLGALLTWARVARSRATASALAKVQTQAHQDDEVPHWQPYGFQSRPKADAVAVLASIGGQADQQIAILVGDRRYTLGLDEGEVAMADDLGNKVHLTRSGLVLKAPSIKLGATASAGVARLGDTVTLSPELVAWLDLVAAAAMSPSPSSPGVRPAATGTITSASSVAKSE